MLLCGFMALILGWFAIVPLGNALLKKRSSPQTLHASTALKWCHAHEHPAGRHVPTPFRLFMGKLACASVSCCMYLAAWGPDAGHAASIALLCGITALLVAAYCDCAQRIIPWETCLAALVSSIVFSVFTRGAAQLVLSLGLAVACTGVLAVCRSCALRLERPDPIGMGDIRLLPALFAFCGIRGSFHGAFACSLVMALAAAIVLVRQRRTGKSAGLPLAPGLCVWFVAGAGV